MYKQITIKTLHKQGQTQADIAKQLDCHRHTVANVLKREQFIEKQTRTKGSLFDPYHEQIKQWIEKKVSILRQFEILTETYGVHSTYINLCKYIQVRFSKQPEAFGVQLTTPGEVAEIDFGYLGMLPGINGKPVKTFGLAVVLGYSRLDYYAICYDQKLETLCSELQNAFLYFAGGITIWMRSSPGSVADSTGRVSSMTCAEVLATARASRIRRSNVSSGASCRVQPSRPSVRISPGVLTTSS